LITKWRFLIFLTLFAGIFSYSGAAYGQTAMNTAGDLIGTNMGDKIILTWAEHGGTSEYVVYSSDSASGPWVVLYTFPGELFPSARGQVHVTPDASSKILCYQVDAKDSSGTVIRTYQPICVPVYVP
jgi:hypothetical protein